MKKITKTIYIILAGALLLFFIPMSGCKKFVQVTAPANQLTQDNAYSDGAAVAAVLDYIYSSQSGDISLTEWPGLSSDEFTLYPATSNTEAVLYYTNRLDKTSFSYDAFWEANYRLIYIANAVIEGVTASSSLSAAVKQQALGEAKFIRAFYYFYLVNFYGDVPLVLTTDYKTNALLSRAPRDTVWKQVINDLLDAQNLLSSDFTDGSLVAASTERVRPSKWAATALLARSYLYTGDWADAEKQASLIIDNTAQFGLSTLNNAFLKASLGNNEAIWQMQPTFGGLNTWEGYFFVILPAGPSDQNPVSLSQSLLNNFEPGDLRMINWVHSITVGASTYYFPFKYKINVSDPSVTSTTAMSEFKMVLRLGEQFLIRAEARAQQGKVSGANSAASDLNAIRTRAGLGNTTASTQTTMLDAIARERRAELFSEWGHRWLDLKRTNAVDTVMGSPGNACVAKGSTWQSYQQWYPVPFSEMQLDPHLVQNEGY